MWFSYKKNIHHSTISASPMIVIEKKAFWLNPPCWQQHNNLKRQTIQALLLILQFGIFPVDVFIKHTHNCGHTWLCNYRGNSLVSQLELSGSAAPCGTQNTGGRGCQTAEQNRTGAGKLHTCMQWNLTVRHTQSHTECDRSKPIYGCVCAALFLTLV